MCFHTTKACNRPRHRKARPLSKHGFPLPWLSRIDMFSPFPAKRRPQLSATLFCIVVRSHILVLKVMCVCLFVSNIRWLCDNKNNLISSHKIASRGDRTPVLIFVAVVFCDHWSNLFYNHAVILSIEKTTLYQRQLLYNVICCIETHRKQSQSRNKEKANRFIGCNNNSEICFDTYCMQWS